MRIAFLTWEYPPSVVGGLGVFSENVVRGLAAGGHDVIVFTLNRDEAPEDTRTEEARVVRPRHFDVTATFPHVIEWSLQQWGLFFNDLYLTNLLWVDRLLKIHSEAPFDLISVQDWLSAPAGLALAGAGVAPLAFHVHSAEWGRQPEGGSRTVEFWERELGARADAVITVSEAMRADLLEHGFPSERLYAIWNGIDPARYNPDVGGRARVRKLYGVADDDMLTLFVGRLTAVKGVMPLVEGWAQVAAVFPEAKLVLLGTGELQGEIEQRVAALGIGDSVSLRPEFVDEGERIAHYAASDLCVFPSQYEPFGIVCLEAMATGKPVVVGARGLVGFREQVINEGPEKCGVHINAFSAGDIAWGIGQCLMNPERAAAWGRNGRRRAETEFTWTETVRKILEIYEGLVAARGG